MNNIETAISQLLREKPFYAHFFLGAVQNYDSKKIPTAGVGVSNNKVCFHWNRDFVAKQTAAQLRGLIEHEVLHFVFEHIFYDYKGNRVNQKNANIAQDCVINQLIGTSNLPEGGVTLEGLSKTLGKKLPPNQTWLYYYGEIEEFAKNNPDKCVESSQFDDHSWDEGGEEKSDSEKQSDMMAKRAAVQHAVEEAVKRSNGQVPKPVLDCLDSLRAEPKLDWKSILSNFIARSRSITRIPTRTRRHRRFGLKAPGYKVKRELTLAVCVDSSGSVSNEAYKTFMDEIARISSLCSKVYLIDADCEVNNVEILKKKAPEYKRHGFGGTAYQPAIDKAIELGVNAIVYFGDMDSADKPKNPNVPFLWAIVGKKSPPSDFGGIVRIDEV